jgi:tight adherence protein B
VRTIVAVVLTAVSGLALVVACRRRGPTRLESLLPRNAVAALTRSAATDAAATGAICVATHLARGSVVLTVLAGLAAWVSLAVRRRAQAERTTRALAGQLPEFAASLGAAVRAGRSIPQAIRRAADDIAEPLAAEVRILVSDIDFGLPLATALEDFAARIGSTDVRLFATTIMLQQRTGGDLPRTLAGLATRLDERDRLGAELRTATAQARMTAWLVGGLPIAGGILVELASPGSLARTLGTSAGLAVVVAAALLQLAGVMLVRRLLRGIW